MHMPLYMVSWSVIDSFHLWRQEPIHFLFYIVHFPAEMPKLAGLCVFAYVWKSKLEDTLVSSETFKTQSGATSIFWRAAFKWG